jgi:hypothetical protein
MSNSIDDKYKHINIYPLHSGIETWLVILDDTSLEKLINGNHQRYVSFNHGENIMPYWNEDFAEYFLSTCEFFLYMRKNVQNHFDDIRLMCNDEMMGGGIEISVKEIPCEIPTDDYMEWWNKKLRDIGFNVTWVDYYSDIHHKWSEFVQD